MFVSNIYIFKFACVFLIVGRFAVVQSNVKDKCTMGTKEMIEYNGYYAEEHSVITEDGYNLTIFRCNSKSVSPDTKKVVLLHHGLLSSSDDYSTNDPSQALAYIMADAGYDVFLSNHRGNFYSRRHITLDPDILNMSERFWNFSWYEVAIYDYPAIFDYVLEETKQPKVYVVGHSQGTTCMMTLLSEKPEYNDYFYAVSLMAPVGYLKHTGRPLQILEKFHNQLLVFENTELLPRSPIGKFGGKICSSKLLGTFCESLLELVLGQSEGQQDSTTLRNNICHGPSGASFNQILHYGSEISYDYFGKYMRDSKVPSDFDLSKIRVPISLHYSPNDKLSNSADVEKLIPKLNNSLALTQVVNQTEFNHIDFIWGKDAAKLVYSVILSFFEEQSGETTI
ncbi:lipase 3-like [Contarinia nasturtii]|uniref:lipase 3-like n=1 Tax=Contarinia nasturtii TaxID=265458 RepID=UPI0012D438EA|nr:lipase 3-like [Contarinia nasturtii]